MNLIGCNYLRNFDDLNTRLLSDTQERLLIDVNIGGLKSEAFMYSQKMQESYSIEGVESGEPKRKYFLKIDDILKSNISKTPFVCQKEQYDCTLNEFKLVGFSHNKLLADLVEIWNINLTDNEEGFHVMRRIRSKNWVNFFLNYLLFKMDDGIDNMPLDKCVLHLENFDAGILNGQFHLYKQIYVEECTIYQENIFVWYLDE